MLIVKNMSARMVDGIVPGALHEFPETEDEIKPYHKRLPGNHDQPGPVVMADAVRKGSSFRARLLVEGDHPMPPARVIDITQLPIDKALLLVSAESDIDMLHAWHDDDRSEVKTACADRALALSNAKG